MVLPKSVTSGKMLWSTLGQQQHWIVNDFVKTRNVHGKWRHGQTVELRRKTTLENSPKTPESILRSLYLFLTVPPSKHLLPEAHEQFSVIVAVAVVLLFINPTVKNKRRLGPCHQPLPRCSELTTNHRGDFIRSG